MTDAHTDSTTHLESEHLKAAREWLDGFMARMTAPDAETSQFSNDRSLAALLAEWERKGLERAVEIFQAEEMRVAQQSAIEGPSRQWFCADLAASIPRLLVLNENHHLIAAAEMKRADVLEADYTALRAAAEQAREALKAERAYWGGPQVGPACYDSIREDNWKAGSVALAALDAVLKEK